MRLIIIALGGSLVVPEYIDTNFVKEFRKTILSDSTKKYIIVVGGGWTARKNQKEAKKQGASEEVLDFVGIKATQENAKIVKDAFSGFAELISIDMMDSDKSVLVSGGYKSGYSTDYVAVLFAEKVGAKKVINLLNIKYIYNKDLNRFLDAKPIKQIIYVKLKELVGHTWTPGMHAPSDPIAVKKAEELGLKLIVLNFKNFKKFLNRKEFESSVVK